jgi:hypothetical protein
MKARVVGMALLALVSLACTADPAPEMNFSWVDASDPLAGPLLQSGHKLTALAALEHVHTKRRDRAGMANPPFRQRVERPGQPPRCPLQAG